MEIPRPISKTRGNYTWCFFINPVYSSPWPVEFPHFVFSILLKSPCPQPLLVFFFWNSPFKQLHWQFFITCIFPVSDEQLINILLQKFDTLSKKQVKMIKNVNIWCKTKKNKKKMARTYMYISIKQHSYLYCELAPLTRDVICLKL